MVGSQITTGWSAIAIVAAAFLVAAIGFVWVAVRLGHTGRKATKNKSDLPLEDLAEEEVSHLFNKEFREELRNRGRLRFEHIIEENAMFLKQDLQLTTSQLNEYMKKQASTKLDSEFDAYAKVMKDLQELAKKSLEQATGDVEKERNELVASLEQEIANRKAAVMKEYEANMAQVVEHYLLKTLGEQIDFKTQLPFILDQMEKNKAAIIEDMKL